MATDPKPSDLTIRLYRGWPYPGVYTWSPFVTKLELLLRLSHIPYTTHPGSTRSSPKGKIPYLTITSASALPLTLSDSCLISKHFIQTGTMKDLNAHLDETNKTLDLAMQSLFEEKLYFYNMRERWIDNYYVQRDEILQSLSWLLRVFVGGVIYRSHVKTLHGQGTGRFSDEEVREFRDEIWTRLNGLLSESRRKKRRGKDKDCFWCLGGEEPTSCDATVFGFVCSALVATSSPESKKFVLGLDAVMDYAERIHEKYFPDYEKWEL